MISERCLTATSVNDCLWSVASVLKKSEGFSAYAEEIFSWLNHFKVRNEIIPEQPEKAVEHKTVSLLSSLLEKSTEEKKGPVVRSLDISSLKRIKRPKGPLKTKNYEQDAVKVNLSKTILNNPAFTPKN